MVKALKMAENAKVTKEQVPKMSFWKKVKKSRVLLLMCLPAILFFFLFSYMPMPGIWVAFVKYNYRDGISGSDFVGLRNFEFLATSGKLFSLTKIRFFIIWHLFSWGMPWQCLWQFCLMKCRVSGLRRFRRQLCFFLTSFRRYW